MGRIKITGKKGIHIQFDSGYTMSIQWGPGNYCDNYHMEIGREDELAGKIGSREVEVAFFKEGVDGLITLPDGDSVMAYQSIDSMMEYMIKAWKGEIVEEVK